MSEFNAHDILAKLRSGGDSATGVRASISASPAPQTNNVRASFISAPSSGGSNIRASITGAGVTNPRASFIMSSAPSSSSSMQHQQATPASAYAGPSSTPFSSAIHTPAPMPSPMSPNRTINFQDHQSRPTSPMYRKEHLDLREALERENKALLDQLKRCKADYKALEQQKDQLVGEYCAYKVKKESLCAKYRGDIAVLTEQLNALTGEKTPKYTNSKPLSHNKPFKPATNTQTYLDPSPGHASRDARGEEVREKLAAVTAAGGMAPFAQPTFTQVMRRITPAGKNYIDTLRSGGGGSKKANGVAGGSSSSSGSGSNNHGSDSHPSSPRQASFGQLGQPQFDPSPYYNHHHEASHGSNGYDHGQGQGQSHPNPHSHSRSHSYHLSNSFSQSGGSRGQTYVFSDRRPGADDDDDDDDVPVVEIDLSTRV